MVFEQEVERVLDLVRYPGFLFYHTQGVVDFAEIVGGEMVGIGTILPQSHEQEGADGWRIRGMATLPVARGTGVGGAVLEHCMTHAEACGARYIWCNARIKALPLYERRGFATVGDVFEPPEIGPHYRMVKFL